jgi:hypothetical protein
MQEGTDSVPGYLDERSSMYELLHRYETVAFRRFWNDVYNDRLPLEAERIKAYNTTFDRMVMNLGMIHVEAVLGTSDRSYTPKQNTIYERKNDFNTRSNEQQAEYRNRMEAQKGGRAKTTP